MTRLKASVMGGIVLAWSFAGSAPGAFAPRPGAEARFREARALEAAGDPRAIEAYRGLLGADLPVPDAVHDALGRLLPPAAAEPHWEAVLAASPANPFTAAALRGLAALRGAQGRWDEAEALVGRLVASGEGAVAAASLVALAQGLDGAGERGRAVAAAERAWVDFADRLEARGAAAILGRGTGDPYGPVRGERLLRRGQVQLEKGRREEAVATFTELRRRLTVGSGLAGDLDLGLGTALYHLRRFAEALEPLGRAAKNPATEESARFYRARSLFGLDRGDEGARDLVALAKGKRGSSRAPQYLLQAHRVFLGRGLAAEATEARSLLLERYPASDEAREVAWGDGWGAFRAERFGEAAGRFRAAAEGLSRGWSRSRAAYWEARALAAQGQADRAARGFAAVVAEVPVGYYGHLARTAGAGRLGDLGLPDLRVAAVRPLRAVTVSPEDEVPPAGEAAEARAAAYLRLALPDAARRVLRGAAGGRAARLLYWAGDYRGAIRAGGRSWQDWTGEVPPEPLSPEGLAFPLAYGGEAAAAAAAAGIHPHLLLAVAHTESHFDPQAYSSAEARGLMQFIPATGARVARAAGIEGFEPEHLFDPGLALRLGARHLRELLDRFEGDPVAAVAAYNAGAGAVERWLKAGHRDGDAFIEAIPYRETRHYVKKVLTALDAYGRLDPPGAWPLP